MDSQHSSIDPGTGRRRGGLTADQRHRINAFLSSVLDDDHRADELLEELRVAAGTLTEDQRHRLISHLQEPERWPGRR